MPYIDPIRATKNRRKRCCFDLSQLHRALSEDIGETSERKSSDEAEGIAVDRSKVDGKTKQPQLTEEQETEIKRVVSNGTEQLVKLTRYRPRVTYNVKRNGKVKCTFNG